MAELAHRVATLRDRKAFVTLFDFFAPRLKAYLRRLGLDDGAAEELCQEVMVVLWNKADLFDPARSSLSTWLFRIARNRRIDLARRARVGALDPDDPSLQPEAPDMPDQGIDAEKLRAGVTAALEALPPDQREAIRMAFFLGYTHSQISQETGLPMGTVKSRIRLAFARLRGVLERDPTVDTD